MIDKLKIKQKIELILFFTAITCLLSFNRNSLALEEDQQFKYALKLLLITLSSFVFFSTIIQYYSKRIIKNIIAFALYVATVYIIYFVVDNYVYSDLTYYSIHRSFVFSGFDLTPLISAILYFILYTSYILLYNNISKKTEAFYKTKARRIELEANSLKVEFERKLSAVDPAFFNHSLKQLRALLDREASKAEDYVVQLASYYRSKLHVMDSEYNLLSSEIKSIEDYCALAKIELKTKQINIEKGLKIASGFFTHLLSCLEEESYLIVLEQDADLIKIAINSEKDKCSELQSFLNIFYTDYQLSFNDKTIQIGLPE